VTTGQRIREARKAADLTQEALAHRASVSLPTVQRLEADRNGARVSTLTALAAALGVPLSDLLSNPDERLVS